MKATQSRSAIENKLNSVERIRQQVLIIFIILYYHWGVVDSSHKQLQKQGRKNERNKIVLFVIGRVEIVLEGRLMAASNEP